MVSKSEISSILSGYDLNNIIIATVCSHSSLQILAGARKEGFRTMGIAIGEPPKFYDAFPLAKPDEFFVVEKRRSCIMSDILFKDEGYATR